MRSYVAWLICLSGSALLPFISLPSEGLDWRAYAGAYVPFDLAVSVDDDQTVAMPGEEVTYVIRVTHRATGLSNVVRGARVVDVFPAELRNMRWSCSASAGSSCGAGGTGDIRDRVDLFTSGTLTYVATGTVAADATGTLTNTVTVSAPAAVVDPDPSNNSATDVDAFPADLAVTADDARVTALPGRRVAYDVGVENLGPARVVRAPVAAVVPEALRNCVWSCTAARGARCAARGEGAVADAVDLPVAASVSYRLRCDVAPEATGTLVLAAAAAVPEGMVDPDTSNNAAVDRDAFPADLRITKDDGLTTVDPGQQVDYTIVLTNHGPGDVEGARVRDDFPAALAEPRWTCTAEGGANCAPGSASIRDAEPNDTLETAQDADLTAWSLGFDADIGDRVAGTSTAIPHLTVVGTGDGTLDYYSFTVAEAPARGLFDVDFGFGGDGSFNSFLRLYDAAGRLLRSVDDSPRRWGQGGSESPRDAFIDFTFRNPGTYVIEVGRCCVSGVPEGADYRLHMSVEGHPTGPLRADAIDDLVDLPVGGSLTYVVTGTVDPSAAGTLVNTVRVELPAGGVDPDPADNSARDSDVIAPPADLSVELDDGRAFAVPGETVAYTLAVTNRGPAGAAGVRVTDAFPEALESCRWRCAAAGGARCTRSGSGDVDELVDLPSGGSATWTATCTVARDATGSLVNTAAIEVPPGVFDPDLGDNAATDVDGFPGDLTITKDDFEDETVAGGFVTYEIGVANLGPGDAAGARVTDVFPGTMRDASWFCTPTGGARCGAPRTPARDVEPNDSLASAQSLEFSLWSLEADPNIGDRNTDTSTRIPHVSLPGTGNETRDYFAFEVPNGGARGVFDIDFASFDSYLQLFDFGGALLASNDDASTSLGQGGSSSRADAFIQYTFPEPGLYVIEVGRCCIGAVPDGGTYQLQVSIEDHPLASRVVGNLRDTVDLPAGSTLTYFVTGRIGFGATGELSNTATVTAPEASPDPDTANNSATDVNAVLPPLPADLSITKDDGATLAFPGQPVSYTVTVTNQGPGDVVGARVSDDVPAALTGVRWTCTPSAGAVCPAGRSFARDVEPNDSIETAQDLDAETWSRAFDPDVGDANANTSTAIPHLVIPGAGNGTFDYYAFTVERAGARGIFDIDRGGDSFFDSHLRLWASDGTLVASNDDSSVGNGQGGSTSSSDAFLDVVFPAPGRYVVEVGGCCFRTVEFGEAYQLQISVEGHDFQSSDDLGDRVDIPAGGMLTYEVTGVLDPAATGVLANTATVTTPARVRDPDSANNRATDRDRIAPPADLALTLDNGREAVTPGERVTYVLTVTNRGPAVAAGAAVTDLLPEDLDDCAWTCAATAGSSCAAGTRRSDVLDAADLAPGGGATYTVTCTVSDTVTGALTNTATVAATGEYFDPDTSNNSATDVDALPADLAVTKDDGTPLATPGGILTYTIEATNLGPGHAIGAVVTDEFPPELEGASWSCSPSGGASCTGAATVGRVDEIEPNDVLEAAQNLDRSSWSLLFDQDFFDELGRNTSTILPHVEAAGEGDGTFDYYAFTVRAAGARGLFHVALGTFFDPHLRLYDRRGNLLASNDDAIGGREPLIDFEFEAPGRYVVEVGSCCVGPVPLVARYILRASVEGHPLSGPNLADTVDLPVGSRVTYTVRGPVAFSAEGTLANTATVEPAAGVPDPDPSNNSATDVDALPVRADLALTLNDGRNRVGPGQAVTYTVTVTNLGPADVAGAAVVDDFPEELESCAWTCSASSGSTCAASGSGSLDDLADLTSGGRATYTANCTVAASAEGVVVNSASVSVPFGVFDPDPSNNTATDSDALPANLAVVKDDSRSSVAPGERVTYVITVTNEGPGDTDATVEDVFPASLLGVTWFCEPSGRASCTPTSSVFVDDREPNDGAAEAQDIDGERWSLSFDPNVGDKEANTSTSLPHLTIRGTGDGTVDLYAFTVAEAGDRGLFDVDFGRSGGDGAAVDTHLRLFAADGTLLAANDDASPSYGRGGSLSGQDAFLEYTFTAPGRYVVEVGACCVSPLPAGGGYLLQVSLAGHPVSSVDLLDRVTLPAGGVVAYTAAGFLDPGAAGTLSNTASVSSPADPDPSDDASTDTDEVTGQADLAVAKRGGAGVGLVGKGLAYTVEVTNAGPLAATGVVLTERLPAAFQAAAVPSRGRCAPFAEETLVCDLGSLAPGETASVEILAKTGETGMVVATSTASAREDDYHLADNTAESVHRVMSPAELLRAKALYGTAHGRDGASTLYALDPATGAARAVGATGFERCTALAFDGAGTLWAACRRPGGGAHVLVTLDRETGAGVEVGATRIEADGEEALADLAFSSDGALIAFSRPRNLGWTIDPASGAAARSAAYQQMPCCVFALAPGPEGKLFEASQSEVRLLDPAAGTAGVVADLDVAFRGAKPFTHLVAMDSAPGSGVLYGVLRADRDRLVTLDAASGRIAVVGVTVEGLEAIAFGPSGGR